MEAESVGSAQVPAWIIADITQQLSMSEVAVHKEFGKTDGSRGCTFDIAFLDAILRKPGHVPIELLRLNF